MANGHFLSVKDYWISMKYHVYIYDRFSGFGSVYQSLEELVIQCKDRFLIKQIAACKCKIFSL